MAFCFGDSFDLYATPTDAVAGYWDSGNPGNWTLVAGRFTGSQAVSMSSASGFVALAKSSGVNDAVHHIVCAFRQTSVLSGSTAVTYFQLLDGVTGQCCIVFRSDGAILLTSGTSGGTVLATYTGAVSAQNTWFAFEFEIVISPTVGRFRARKNGNTSDDFDSGATLNTRPGTNSYANKLQLGNAGGGLITQQFDDVLWRSDVAVPWVGDVRCYTRMPASDASVQFLKSPTNIFGQTNSATADHTALTSNNIRATPVVCPSTGTLTSLSFNFSVAMTGHAKMALYDATGTGGGAGSLLASSVELTNPGAGGVTAFSVAGGPVVTKGTTYWVAIWSDASITPNGVGPFTLTSDTLALAYTTSFPATMVGFAASTAPGGLGSNGMNVTPMNAMLVNETLQDGTTTYVYNSTVGDADFYNLASLASTPVSVVAVTTRGFCSKSDSGARGMVIQLKSSGTTVQSPTPSLGTTFGWLWRTDLTDPATGITWTPAAVNNVQIGPIVTS